MKMNNFNCCEFINTNTSKAEQDTLTALGMVMALTQLEKNTEKIKELITLNSSLKEENIILKGEKELLKKNLELSEEIRNNSSEKKIIELQEDKRELQYKIQELKYELTKQIQVNVYLVQLLREKEE